MFVTMNPDTQMNVARVMQALKSGDNPNLLQKMGTRADARDMVALLKRKIPQAEHQEMKVRLARTGWNQSFFD